ncbi:unnamed protein product [Closterium sp. NIES-53]
MARNVIESVNIMEASAYVIWQAYDFYDRWSFILFPMYTPPYNGPMEMPMVNKRFWLFKHFTLLAKPGSKPIREAGDRRVTLYLDRFKTNAGGRTSVTIRRTTAFTNFSKKVFTRFRGISRVTMWGQTFVSITFTNVAY